ncbi:uncharacterized protein BDV17DRAFT_250544 [Aspergillus undulatus]|uniref:uncharacterized protein n=1 Tax=Aspergillus undulatus TaxID=1810928 RepID=UPI003CCDC1CE
MVSHQMDTRIAERQWQRQASNSKRIRKLRHFLRYHIIDQDTLDIIEEISDESTNVMEWQGTEFAIHRRVKGEAGTTDEGKALLRTPDGVGSPISFSLIRECWVRGFQSR